MGKVATQTKALNYPEAYGVNIADIMFIIWKCRQWNIYPNQWVKLLILNSHETGDKEYIDEMEVTKNFNSDDEVTDELVNCTDKEIVYHTGKEEICSEIRNIFFSYRNRRM